MASRTTGTSTEIDGQFENNNVAGCKKKCSGQIIRRSTGWFNSIRNLEFKEVGYDAVWSVSSAKSPNCVKNLMDENWDTYWQSDGSLPHTIRVDFPRLTKIATAAFKCDYCLDNSYAPERITINYGIHPSDVRTLVFDADVGISDWCIIEVKQFLPDDECIFCTYFEIKILDNQDHGRDSRVRSLKFFSESPPVGSPMNRTTSTISAEVDGHMSEFSDTGSDVLEPETFS